MDIDKQTSPAGDPDKILALAKSVLETEAQAVLALAGRLDANFVAAVNLVPGCKGRVVVSGIGKSGHIAHKIAGAALGVWLAAWVSRHAVSSAAAVAAHDA